MQHHFQTEQWIPRPVDEMFLFFADPNNLPPLMPRWQHARIDRILLVAPPEPAGHEPTIYDSQIRPHAALAGSGSSMTISFRPVPLSPLRLTWDAVIRDFVWNSHFCDEQLRGPFHSWRHCHRVREQVRGGIRGTVVTDDLAYTLPAGVLGDVAKIFGGALQIRLLFRHRQRMLASIFPARR